MNKLLIATASTLVIAAAAYANESDIDQNGTGNTAEVDQTGGAEGTASINQGNVFAAPNDEANNSFAKITQSEVSVGSPGFSVPTNSATINQTGENMGALVEQRNYNGNGATNVVVIDQASNGAGPTTAGGYSQEAVTTQLGEGNTADIDQGQTNASPPPNRSGQQITVNQTGDFNASTSDQRGNEANASITQSGAMNVSGVAQIGLEDFAVVTQSGNGNESTVDQTGNFNDAFVTQSGDGNISGVVQDGGAQSSLATVNQDGSSNESNILQTDIIGGAPVSPRSSNIAFVSQLGDRGSSTIRQGGATNGNNDAQVFQVGADETSVIEQTGDRNLALVSSQSGGGNYSLIVQPGSDNEARVDQASGDNFSDVFQSGSFNEADVNQLSTSGNVSYVTQNGTGNMAMVNQ